MTVLVEACVTSPAEASRAVAAGAHRLEVCRDLDVDGLTPGPDLLRAVLDRVAGHVPVFAMVRPAPGPHVCRTTEWSQVLDSVQACVEMGAAGIVAGFLEADEGRPTAAGQAQIRPDLDLMGEIVEMAAPARVTFHKAFDLVQRPEAAAAALQDVGVARILTAGGPGTAVHNLSTLRALVELQRAGQGPEVIAAGGVRGSHVTKLINATGVHALHARGSAIPGIARALRGP